MTFENSQLGKKPKNKSGHNKEMTAGPISTIGQRSLKIKEIRKPGTSGLDTHVLGARG